MSGIVMNRNTNNYTTTLHHKFCFVG